MENEMHGWQWYGTKHLQVCPYMNGVPVYRDGMLPYLYTQLRQENHVAITFCGQNKTQDEFVSYFDKIKTLQVLCRVEDNKTLKPIGFSWLDSPIGIDGARMVRAGMAFFGGSAKTKDARDVSRLALAYAFIDLKIDVLHGYELIHNIPARNFSARLGAKQIAIVPNCFYWEGKLVAGRVMELKKEDYLPKFNEWFEKQEKP